MAKKFSFKGMEIEQLQKLSTEEFIPLLPSKLRRTLRRNSAKIKKFMLKLKKKRTKPMKTHLREMIVLPEMVGRKFQVYNGNSFVDVNVVPEMIGHRLGELSITVKLVKHSGPGIGATRGSKSVELK